MFAQVLVTEVAKLRRSAVPPATLVGFSMAPLAIALFMWIVREPGRASQLGLLGAKANLSGLEATWASFASMLTLITGIGGMLLLPFVVAYVFGREYADGTAKNLLALPVGRHWFAVAKFVVAGVWWVVLVIAVLAEALLLGLALGLPGFSAAVAVSAVGNALVAASISYLFVPIVAWVTVAGRGYMAPIAFALAMMALGNIFGKTGWSAWFPWSIVPSLVGLVGNPVGSLPAGSYVVLAVTFVGGIAATIAQLRWADNAQ
jgi:ABC-2 type transport system permease protein